jgi:lipoprotein-anchoring transpeptidase ErfK/SrfK
MHIQPLLKSLRVDLATQTLDLLEAGVSLRRYPVSTGLAGAGEAWDSGCTPRGLHRVRLRIGAGCPVGTVFVGRRLTGEVYGPDLAARFPERDWILTRILWLTGLEPGRNRGGDQDTLRRFIYIHGCPDIEPMGVPRSHGCVRMRNADLIELFDQVANGTLVEIMDGAVTCQAGEGNLD